MRRTNLATSFLVKHYCNTGLAPVGVMHVCVLQAAEPSRAKDQTILVV